jgi:hypothetical protein
MQFGLRLDGGYPSRLLVPVDHFLSFNCRRMNAFRYAVASLLRIVVNTGTAVFLVATE